MTLSVLPGEAAIVAIASLIEKIADGQSPEQKQVLWARYIELTAPFHAIQVEINKNIAKFIENLIGTLPKLPAPKL